MRRGREEARSLAPAPGHTCVQVGVGHVQEEVSVLLGVGEDGLQQALGGEEGLK